MDVKVNWKLENEISKCVEEPPEIVSKVISLLEQDNTVPFISRYRQEMTKGMTAEKIRSVKEKLEELKKVEKKAINAVKLVMKSERRNPLLEQSILSCVDEDVITELVAPFKPSKKPSKLQEAHSFDLQNHVAALLAGKPINFNALVNKKVKALDSPMGVGDVVSLLVAEEISNQPRWLSFLMQQCQAGTDVMVTSKRVVSKKTPAKVNVGTFKDYFDYKAPFNRIRPHKYLAIQRGKSLNVLKSDIEIPSRILHSFMNALKHQHYGNRNSHLLERSFRQAYDDFLHKRLLCLIRQKLAKEAENAALKSFSRNLSQLLLEQPVRDKVIMGVDPGFTNACKYAVINKNGDVLLTGKAFISKKGCLDNNVEVAKIREALLGTNCDLVAIGDGVGSRETEEFFHHHIKKGTFKPLNVLFCIAKEAGASVYSASEQAQQELPDLDVSLRGAVSIARRTQDPLVELIKIDPKNLGIGMYQHDLPDSKLRSALEGVVEDCVSFVGVDLNVCSQHLLEHVAGIGPSLAKSIVLKRRELGAFVSREQLKEVSGLGAKKFTQCVGFLRIIGGAPDGAVSSTAFNPSAPHSSSSLPPSRKRKNTDKETDAGVKRSKLARTNTLDRTSVHPEAYAYADQIIQLAGLDKRDVASEAFVKGINKYRAKTDMAALAKRLGCGVETTEQVVQSLSQVTEFDIRSAFGKPLLRSGVQWSADLRPGTKLLGKAMNVTDFGVFVDVGVERHGLIHVSKLPPPSSNKMAVASGYGRDGVSLGDVLEVVVLHVQGDKVALALSPEALGRRCF